MGFRSFQALTILIACVLLFFTLASFRVQHVNEGTNEETIDIRNLFLEKLLTMEHPIILSSPKKPQQESELRTLDILEVKDDRVYFLAQNIWEFLNHKATKSDLKLEDELTLDLHKNPEPYTSNYLTKRKNLRRDPYPVIHKCYGCYRSLEGSYQTMEFLESEYPSLVEVLDVGPTYLKSIGKGGHEMKVLKITNKNSIVPKSPMFVICSIHAREITPAETCARFAEDILEEYGKDSDKTWILNYTEIHIFLQANPDGREYEEASFYPIKRLKRKNMNMPFLCKGRFGGVDLNRNFPHSKWKESTGFFAGCLPPYSGTSPGSEKEIQAIVNHMESVIPPGTNTIDPITGAFTSESKGVMMDIHNSGQVFYWPYTSDGVALAPNKVDLFALGKKLAARTVPTYRSDNESPYSDPATGVATHYAYETLGIAGYAMELGDRFYERCDYFENTIVGNVFRALLYLARVSHAPYQLPKGPDVINMTLSSTILSRNETLQVVALVSDNKEALGYDTGNQVITSVQLFLDSHPYDTGSTPNSEITDEFESPSEEVTFDISMNETNVGQHILYIQAYDTEGPGPVYSKFIEVTD